MGGGGGILLKGEDLCTVGTGEVVGICLETVTACLSSISGWGQDRL